MSLPAYLSEKTGHVLLAVKAQPRASKNAVGEAVGNELKIKVTAPPVDSAANDALIFFLAGVLDCSRQRIELVRGQSSRHKIFKLHGLSATEVAAALAR